MIYKASQMFGRNRFKPTLEKKNQNGRLIIYWIFSHHLHDMDLELFFPKYCHVNKNKHSVDIEITSEKNLKVRLFTLLYILFDKHISLFPDIIN